MLGVVIGHGSYDGNHKAQVNVPKTMQLDFFTDEGSPLAMVNLLELLKSNNPRRPLEKVTGAPVTNYLYEPFKTHELTGISTLDELRLPATQMLVVGTPATPDPIRLCSDSNKCAQAGSHVCDGVLGRAVKAGWTQVLILSCRSDTSRQVQPTVELMDAAGHRTRAVYDGFLQWGKNFVAMDHAAQDAAWTALSRNERIYRIAIAEDIREWAEARDARTRIDGAQDKNAVAAALAPSIKVLLMRDYPQYRAVLATGVVLTGQETHDIATFKQRHLNDQTDEWDDLTRDDPARQARWMTDPGVAHLAAALNALMLFHYGLNGTALASVVRRLEPEARAVVVKEPPIQAELRPIAPDLLTP